MQERWEREPSNERKPPNSFWYNCSSDFCHIENKREVFCLDLLHPDRTCMNHNMTSAASRSSPKLPSLKSNTGILLLAMEEGQLWPPDRGPSSWGPHHHEEVKVVALVQNINQYFLKFTKTVAMPSPTVLIWTKAGAPHKLWSRNAHRTSWRHPSPCDPQASRYFGCYPEQVMNNFKKSLKIQTPLFLTSL